MKIEKFEDIEAWKKSRELTKEIYRITKQRDFACDNVMRDQIRRAVIPISSNIADGFEREGNKEFTQFPSIAKGSCGEVRSQLYLAFDQQCISAEKHHGLNQECLATSRLISGLIKYLRQSELRGSKYR